jgi:DUF971 family protein
VPRPKKLSASRSKRTLEIVWDDGRTCEISLSALRSACPCAECRAGRENPPSQGLSDPSNLLELPVLSTAAIEIDHMEVSGNYSLQIRWKDGHSYGIYPWDYLRDLCVGVEEAEGGTGA